MRSSQVWMRSSQVWMRYVQVWMRSSRVWMRSRQVCMRSSQVWMRSSQVWMRYSQVVRASGWQCHSRNNPGFDPSIPLESEGRQTNQCWITYIGEWGWGHLQRMCYVLGFLSTIILRIGPCTQVETCVFDNGPKPYWEGFFSIFNILICWSTYVHFSAYSTYVLV